ncbi:type II secretion system protein GspC [Shewanella intestini]|uniref:Type II secretion system protein GspC n=1 Tax=Shewanella intestini TaxID=2017544 RepID=A0ABS5I6J9_9GAMM|nr:MULTISPECIES: type II secretion system protein GspC [Shewanella]MBR9729344.1 type II secretion system protein GspC [Shewanella intestini]MRG37423.1 type II secretion system protein GspC [Shewanella sp. XMDDZSB0408]
MDLLDKLTVKAAGVPQKPLSNMLFGLGVIIALLLAAQITWKLIPVPTDQSVWRPSAVSSHHNNDGIDLNKVHQLALFGDANKQPTKPKVQEVVQITDAPKTNLSIQLTGVVASTAETKGLAIIDLRGTQDTYGLGDKIKGTSASLKEVYADRIIITNGGRYETLMLDGLKYNTNSTANQSLQEAKSKQQVKKLDKRDNAAFSKTLSESRAAIMADPSKITDFIAISPVRKGQEIDGYRLNPGKDIAMFRAAGFKANDLAKSINGYDLTDMGQGLEIMSQLPELTEMSVMVERDGQLVEIMFSLPEQ